MSDNAVAILLGVLGSSTVCELVRYAIGKLQSSNKLEEKFKAIDDRLAKQEKDIVRGQLMTLIHDYPQRQDEIMEVAHHYFVDLKGNWYMTALFKEWCEAENIEVPNWVN